MLYANGVSVFKLVLTEFGLIKEARRIESVGRSKEIPVRDEIQRRMFILISILVVLFGLGQPIFAVAADQATSGESIQQLERNWYRIQEDSGKSTMQLIPDFAFEPTKEPWNDERYRNCIDSKAKLYSKNTAKAIPGSNNILAILECPGRNDGGAVSVVALFDRTRMEKPLCFSRIQFMDKQQDRYYWWGSVGNVEVRRQRDNTLFVAVHLGGSDAGDFWNSSAFLHVDRNCGLTLLSKFYGSGHIDDEGECSGEELSHQLVGESEALLVRKKVLCNKDGKRIRPTSEPVSKSRIDLQTLLRTPKLRRFEPKQ